MFKFSVSKKMFEFNVRKGGDGREGSKTLMSSTDYQGIDN